MVKALERMTQTKYPKCASAWVDDFTYDTLVVMAKEKGMRLSQYLRSVFSDMVKAREGEVKEDIIPEEVNCA